MRSLLLTLKTLEDLHCGWVADKTLALGRFLSFDGGERYSVLLCPFSTRAPPPKSSLPLIWAGVEGEVPASSYAMQVHFQRVGVAGVQSRSHSPNQMLEQGQGLETEWDLWVILQKRRPPSRWRMMTTCWPQAFRLQTGWNQRLMIRIPETSPCNITPSQSEESYIPCSLHSHGYL